MDSFLEQEKERQTRFKQTSPHFSDDARQDGIYKKRPRPFCLPKDYACENLFAQIRENALTYFDSYQIRWHNGDKITPSNHLCDSQVCCVNFLFPFMDKPQALAELLRPLFPAFHEAQPIEAPHSYLAFEWIGKQNYLGETTTCGGRRTRGAYITSADAMVMFRHSDDTQQIVLIEWKYTESYDDRPLRYSRSGTDRIAIYTPLYERNDCPLDKSLIPTFDTLFYEPFYQLMRQQLLAHEMERAREFNANIVSVLHIAPAHNKDFQRVTSFALRPLGTTTTDVWERLVKPAGRFKRISTETLFGNFPVQHFPELTEWWNYIHARYAWLNDAPQTNNE